MTFVPKENPNTEGVVAPNNKPRRRKPRFNYKLSVRAKTEKGKATRDTWYWSWTGDNETDVRKEVREYADKVVEEMGMEDRRVSYVVEDIELLETVPVPD